MDEPASRQSAPESEPVAPTPEPVTKARRVGGGLRAAGGFLRRNAYLGVAAAALLVITNAVDFTPPDQVRVGPANVAQLVGDAPPQEFAHHLSNPQAAQVRATLRMYPDNQMEVGAPDPEVDEQGKLLSQPVVTTLLGMNATVEQTIRLEDGDLEIDLALNATPRLGRAPRRNAPRPVVLEHEVSVKSRRAVWYSGSRTHRVHLDSRGFLEKVEEDGYRVVFTVDEHLFSLDLEVRRASGPVSETLASGK